MLKSDGTCGKCLSTCSECDETDRRICTSCASGLELIDGECVECPLGCAKCKDGKCGFCLDKYTPNSNGVCVLKCKLPCLTCVDNHPTLCLSCSRGSFVENYKCVLNETCNTDKSCTGCGFTNNYFLNRST